jgi:kynureninase
LSAPEVYLASHSMGRPLDAVERDLAEGVGLWQQSLSRAWEPWLAEESRYRGQLAGLLGAARVDGVVPRVSAGSALRTVLNMLPDGARVLSTEGEFDSIAMLLALYARAGRIGLVLVSAGPPGALAEAVRGAAEVGRGFALVVVSQVFFATGQVLAGLDELAGVCREHGARLLVDSYHALGVVPVDVEAMGCDYMIGGCYKYLRGGPGAAFLYLAPAVIEAGLQPVDTSWFALEAGAAARSPELRAGGDALLEGTPAVLSWYQARSGLAFTRAVGVERLRAYGLFQLQVLRGWLEERGVASGGGDEGHGAFLTVAAESVAAAGRVVERLGGEGIVVNARGCLVRLGPDCLTARSELEAAAQALGRCRVLLGPRVR